jgi:glycosyltransferase involved in cell wall biosynthesis
MDITVTVCTHNRARSLQRTLASLAQMNVPPDVTWELIVVDNNSSDDTRSVVEEFARTSGLNVRYVFEAKQGLSHARNTGVREARGKVVAFTDDDVVVDSNWITGLGAALLGLNAMAVGGRCLADWDGVVKPSWVQTDGPFRLREEFFLEFNLGDQLKLTRIPPWGLNMAFRKKAFEKYGLFRADLGVVGSKRMLGEDTEFGRRLVQAGEKIAYAPNAIVRHPIDPRRLTKPYVLSYYFSSGQSSQRERAWSKETICYFGVPRYIYRSLVVDFLKWMSAVESSKRLYFKLSVYRCLGAIYEAFRPARDRE